MSKFWKKLSLLGLVLCMVLGISGIAAACKEEPAPEEPAHTTHVDSNNDGKCDVCGENMPDDGTQTPPVTGGCTCEGCDDADCPCTGDCSKGECENCFGCMEDDADLTFPAEYHGKWTANFDGDVYIIRIKEHRFMLTMGGEVVPAEITVTPYEELDGSTAYIITATIMGDDYDVSLMAGDNIIVVASAEYEMALYFLKSVLPTDLEIDSIFDGEWEAYGMPDIVIADGAITFGGEDATIISAVVKDERDTESPFIAYQYYFVTADGEIYYITYETSSTDPEVESLSVNDIADTFEFGLTYVPKGTLDRSLTDYVGTWDDVVVMAPSMYQIVITADSLVVNFMGNPIASSYSFGLYGVLIISFEGSDYEVTLVTDYLMQLSDENGNGGYYISSALASQGWSIGSEFDGEWAADGLGYHLIVNNGSVQFGPYDEAIIVDYRPGDFSTEYRILFKSMTAGLQYAILSVNDFGGGDKEYTIEIVGENDRTYYLQEYVRTPYTFSDELWGNSWRNGAYTLSISSTGVVSFDNDGVTTNNITVYEALGKYEFDEESGAKWIFSFYADERGVICLQDASYYNEPEYLISTDLLVVDSIPSALVGTRWEGTGFANNNYNTTCTIVIIFTEDGITISVDGGTPQEIELWRVNEGDGEYNAPYLTVFFPGKFFGGETNITFGNGSDTFANATTLSVWGAGYMFELTKDTSYVPPVTYTVEFYAAKGEYSGAAHSTTTIDSENTLGGNAIPGDPSAPDAYHTFVGWFCAHCDVQIVAGNFTPADHVHHGTTVIIYAGWTRNNVDVPETTATAWQTPQYVYPLTLAVGDILTLEADLTFLKGNGINNWDGVLVALSPALLTANTHIDALFAPRYDDWLNNTLGWTAARTSVLFDNVNNGWVAGYEAMIATADTVDLTIIVSYFYAGHVEIKYVLEANYGDADHTFEVVYAVNTHIGSAPLYVGLSGEDAKIENGVITYTTHTHDFGEHSVDMRCACGAINPTHTSHNYNAITHLCACGALDSAAGFTADDFAAANVRPANFNAYDPKVVLTKGSKLIVVGTQKGLVADNGHAFLWEFSEGWTGRPDNHGWSFSGHFGAWNTDNSRSTNLQVLNGGNEVASGVGVWTYYVPIAQDCTWSVEAFWAANGKLTVTITLVANSGTYAGYVFTYTAEFNLLTVEVPVNPEEPNGAKTQVEVTELHLHFGAEQVTYFSINGHRLLEGTTVAEELNGTYTCSLAPVGDAGDVDELVIADGAITWGSRVINVYSSIGSGDFAYTLEIDSVIYELSAVGDDEDGYTITLDCPGVGTYAFEPKVTVDPGLPVDTSFDGTYKCTSMEVGSESANNTILTIANGVVTWDWVGHTITVTESNGASGFTVLIDGEYSFTVTLNGTMLLFNSYSGIWVKQ